MITKSRTATRLGGWSLIVAAVAFMAVFSWLAAAFGYPDVLDGAAPEVLPKLLALGATGRTVWALYALIPLLIIPAAVGAAAAWRDVAPNAVRLATVLGVMAAISMVLGLARWSTVHWELAQAWGAAGPDAQAALGAVFSGLNAYQGNFIGEFLGEIALSGFFIATAFAMARGGHSRWLSVAGYVVGVTGLVAAARNLTDAVRVVSEVNNYLLPVWLVVLGAVLMRHGRALHRTV